MHSINILDNCLLAAHAQTAAKQTGRNHHRQHLRHQADGNRQRKGKGFQPSAAGNTQKHEHNRNQHRHKAQHHPGNRIGALLKRRFILGLRLGKAAVKRILTNCQNNALALAADNNCRHKGKVCQLRQRFCTAVAESATFLFQNRTFTRYGSLRNKQIADLRQPHIGRHTLTGAKQDDIAHHQLFRRNFCKLAVASDCYSFVNQLFQLLRRTFGTDFLHQTDSTADQNHSKDNNSGSSVFGHTGSRQGFRHQRDYAQNKKNYIKRIDKRPPQAVKRRIIFARRKAVAAITFPHCLCLRR